MFTATCGTNGQFNEGVGAAMYYTISSGTCAKAGYATISTLEQCNQAAEDLGLSDKIASSIVPRTGVTYGLNSEKCQWDSYWNRLDFNADATPSECIVGGQISACFCVHESFKCEANTCTPTQVSNSNKASANTRRGRFN